MRRASVLLVVLALAAACAAAAHARVHDDGVLNQTTAQDATGDSGGGPDLASLTVTTYADGTISFAGTLANRSSLGDGETVQLFIDLNDDGTEDLDLSLWPSGAPSYLDRWTGKEWSDIRQLPELQYGNGTFSLRLPLSVYRDAANVPIGSEIGVDVGTWVTDPATGKLGTNASDWLPDAEKWIHHLIQKPSATPPAGTTTTSTGGFVVDAPPRLRLACSGHVIHATVTAPSGARILSVAFSANGAAKAKATKPPWAAAISTRGLHGTVTVRAAVRMQGETRTVAGRVRAC